MDEKKELINIFDYGLFDWAGMKTHSISTSKSTQKEDKKSFIKTYKLNKVEVAIEPKSYPEFLKTGSVGIVYSGGYDSTVLMLQALMNGETVKPIIFNFAQDDIIKAVNLSILKNRFGENLLEPIWFGFFGLQGGMCGTQCTQQLAIHNMLTYLSNDVLKSLKEIQVGYVMNDDAVSFQEELKDVVSTGFKIQDKVNVPITYPLIQKHKYYIDDFIQQHLGFNHLCLSCQFPSFNYYKDSDALYIITTTCNDCTSCMHSQLYNLNFYRGNCVVLATRIPFAKRSCF